LLRGRWGAVRSPTLIAACGAVAAVISTAGCGSDVDARAVPQSTRPSPSALSGVLRARSVLGRPIVASEVGSSPAHAPAVLVVGCIHGDEQAGIAIVRRLKMLAPPRAAALWVLPVLNPDGVSADTRQNADGVDLNRNFPYRWQQLGVRGDQQSSGAHALSEPESRFAYRLILRLRPRITIWFHQPLGLVDESGGNPMIERRFAHLAGLPLRRLTRYPGSAVGWQDHQLPGTTAFVVELPPGRPSPAEVTRWATAVELLARFTPRSG
jgi:murein peptide amidase A